MSQTKMEEILWNKDGLDHQSDINMIYYYMEELIRIQNGENALKVLGEGMHTNLNKRGILKTRHRHAGKETVISPMILHMLYEEDSL